MNVIESPKTVAGIGRAKIASTAGAKKSRAAIRSIGIVAASVLLGVVGLTVSAPSASAATLYAPNAWGECNTAKPGGYNPIYLQRVSVPAGRPSNYYSASCFYYGYTGRWYVPVYRAVNWQRACDIEWARAGIRYRVFFRSPDATYWCQVG